MSRQASPLSTSVLVTGFEPFGGFAENPSGDVARLLDGETVAGHSIVGRVLPVVLDGHRARIGDLLTQSKPVLVVALGLTGDATALRLERQAVNRVDFAIADNGGAMPRDGTLRPDGPLALTSTISLTPIAAALAAAGLAATMSESAGTYLCNATFYHFLDIIRRRELPTRCAFIHVPPLASPPGGGFTLAQLADATRLVIEVAVQAKACQATEPAGRA